VEDSIVYRTQEQQQSFEAVVPIDDQPFTLASRDDPAMDIERDLASGRVSVVTARISRAT